MLPSHRADKRMDKPSEERLSTHSTQRASLELRPLGTLSDLPTEILFRIMDQINDFDDLWCYDAPATLSKTYSRVVPTFWYTNATRIL